MFSKFKKRFIDYINRRKVEKRAFNSLKSLLRSGFYYFSYTEMMIVKIDLKKIFCTPPHNLFFNFTFKKRGLSFVTFSKGYNKLVLMLHDECICIPYNTLLYIHVRDRCAFLSSFIPYNVAPVFHFDDNNSTYKQKKIDGIHLNDKKHFEIMIKTILESAVVSPSNYLDKTYLQHGDFKPQNILWIGNDYILIDIDDLSFYPILFDFFHFCAISQIDALETIALLEANSDLVNLILNKFDMSYSIKSIDYIACKYIEYFRRVNPFWKIDDYIFLKKLKKSEYPKTAKALEI